MNYKLTWTSYAHLDALVAQDKELEVTEEEYLELIQHGTLDKDGKIIGDFPDEWHDAVAENDYVDSDKSIDVVKEYGYSQSDLTTNPVLVKV